jgi:hypothetical protein
MGSKLLFNVPKELAYVEVGEKPVIEMGINEFLDVLEFGSSLYNAYLAAKEDGSINLADLPKLWEPLKLVKKAIEGASLIPAELLGLDLSEAEEIIKRVQERFNVTAEKAKTIIENAVKALVHIKNVIEAVA